MAGPEDWGAVPVVEQDGGPASWGAVPDEQEQPDTSPSFMGGVWDRVKQGFHQDPNSTRNQMRAKVETQLRSGLSNYPGDVADVFMEGVHQTADAVMGGGKSQFDELRGNVENQLISVGRTPEEAKGETDRLMEGWKRQERMQGLVMGPLTAITAPIFGGPMRSFISRPVEEQTGFPKEATEGYLNVAAGAVGLRSLARMKIFQDGRVEAKLIGDAPKPEDFKTAADALTNEPSSKIEPMSGRPQGMPAVKISRDGGEMQIDVSSPGEAQIFRADVPEEKRGRGIAVKMYEDAVRYAAENGRRLISDSFVSSDATRVYEALERRGYQVTKSPDAVAVDGGLSTERRGPVFEVSGRAKPSEGDASWLTSPPTPEVVARTEANLRAMWEERGIHPAEAVHDAQNDAWARNELTQPIEAYHGSPHDFEAFDMSKIGSGEGAQAYGHGLYFAESKGVAESYRHQLAGVGVQIDTRPGSPTQGLMIASEPGGATYKVRINVNREHMLDWDKPLSEQAPYVQDALKKIIKNPVEGDPTGEQFMRSLGSGSEPQAVASKALNEAGIPGIKYLDQGSRVDKPIENATIQYDPVDKKYRIRDGDGAIAGETDTLEDARGVVSGNGTVNKTSNFVIFDDKLIDITHKNGEALSPRARAEAIELMVAEDRQPSGTPHSLGAAASQPPLVSPAVQPSPPPGSMATAIHDAGSKLFDIGRDIQMKVAPMATGTKESIATAKDFMNNMRRNRWEWARIDADIEKRFTPEQRKRMWDAADEESVARQLGESTEHQGLITLDPEERLMVDVLHARAQNAWLRAVDLGMVEGEGLPAYTPRMVMNVANALADDKALPLNSMGNNLKTSTPNLRKRKYTMAEETEAAAKLKYGDQAELARDIRTLPLATAKLEDAIAGRILVNAIESYGKAAGDETVAIGAIPAGSEHKWFTIDNPALKKWRPKFEKADDGTIKAVKDADGNVVFEQVPIYIRGDFEGPLRASLTTKSGAGYQAVMALKAKTMGVIMIAPTIHNMVEFGRAFPAMPVRIFKAYFDGNRAKNDPVVMREAIDNGLVPIGKRFLNQDITSIMEAPDLTPGRSWTSQVLAAVPGLFDEAAGTAVKRAIDKAGDFWHNTLLWDRIADLQMGIYTNLRGDLIKKGVDPQTSSRMAAHMANRYAGALPQEAMSQGATKLANFFLFSRTFTMGNLGVMKDMFTGLPKDVLAQIERDAGVIDPRAVGYAKSLARRKAAMTILLDVGLLYVGNSVLQSALNVMLGDKTLDEETHGYTRRLKDTLNKIEAHPFEMLQPFNLANVAEGLSSTSENEPGKKDRLKIGTASDGTAIYARNPVGKIGEEFMGYFASPIDMLRRKEGTIARPMMQVFSNDKGFGRKVYDPNAETPFEKAAAIWAIVEHIAKAQTPEGQINAFSDLVRGEGDPKVSVLQSLGPFAGVTFSKGAPGGPAIGEMYSARTRHQFSVDLALPDIRRQIVRGDMQGAMERMNELGIPPALQRFYIRTSLNPSTRLSPKALMDFYRYATPEQRERMERAQQQ